MTAVSLLAVMLRAAATGAALSISALGALAQSQVHLGIGGVDAAMSPDQVAAVLTAQGQRVFSKSVRYVESTLTDPETGAPLRARYLFEEEPMVRLKSVEFVQDDDKFVRQYISWQTRLGTLYGPPVSKETTGNSLKDYHCHSRNVSLQLVLFEQRAVLAYFFSPEVSGNCQKAVAARSFEPVMYDWRPPSERKPPSRGNAGRTAEPEVRAQSALSGAPSPLEYAPNRGQKYQETLRCISVAAYLRTVGSAREQQFWAGVAQRMTSDMVRVGRAEGMSPGQVDTEGRSIAARNHAAYREGKESSSVRYLEMDRQFCRQRGLLPE